MCWQMKTPLRLNIEEYDTTGSIQANLNMRASKLQRFVYVSYFLETPHF